MILEIRIYLKKQPDGVYQKIHTIVKDDNNKWTRYMGYEEVPSEVQDCCSHGRFICRRYGDGWIEDIFTPNRKRRKHL